MSIFIESIASRILWPLRLAARLPAGMFALLAALVAAVPYLIHPEACFRADDFVVVADGYALGLGEGLLRSFDQPFLDTRLSEFYRPLYRYAYVLSAHAFGGDAAAYQLVNVAWHGLSVGLVSLILRRLAGAEAAVLGTLLFVTNPWAVNNVHWQVGSCTSVPTVSVVGSTLLYLRYVDGGRSGLPILAIFSVTLGVFFRETALLAPFLAFLVDLKERRHDLRAWRDWVLMTLPVVGYVAARTAVLGATIGGYSRFAAHMGEAPGGRFEQPWWWKAVGDSVLDLLVPGRGDVFQPFFFDGLRIAQCAVVGGVLVLATFRFLKRGSFRVLAIFAFVHATPMLMSVAGIHGSNSQRWHTVLWAVHGGLAVLALASPLRNVSAVLLVALAAMNGIRLEQNLRQYDEATAFTNTVLDEVARHRNELVFVYNVPEVYLSAPLFMPGLGHASMPPFGDNRNAVYAVNGTQLFDVAPTSMTPVAPVLHARGRDVAMLWVDREAIPPRVFRVPDAMLDQAAAAFAAMPRLDVLEPEGDVTEPSHSVELRVRADGIARIDLRIVQTGGELVFRRQRGLHYPDARFETTPDGEFFVETLSYPLEGARLANSPADGVCWLWIVGYSSIDGRSPVASSEIIQIAVKEF